MSAAVPRGARVIYRYAWGPRFRVPGLPVLDRKGQLCRVLVRGGMNSALVEFEDGAQAVVSRNALRCGVSSKKRGPEMIETWTPFAQMRLM